MDLSFTLVCHHCGKSLEETTRMWSKPNEVYMVPCADCLANADQEGYRRGYDVGRADGYSDGLLDGETTVRDDVKTMLQIVKEESEVNPCS